MSVLFNRRESRSITWDSWMKGGPAPRRGSVSGDNAMNVIPVYAAVALIVDSLATLPLHVYQENANGVSTRITTPPILLKPDPTLTRVSWLTQMMIGLLLRGNSYGVLIGPPSAPTGVRWIHPDMVQVDETGTAPLYRVGGGPVLEAWPLGPIFHLTGISHPGSWTGLSPVAKFKKDFETHAFAAGYGRDFFMNSAQPSGILKNALSTLDPVQSQIAKERFVESVRGLEPVVLDKNWDWTQVSITPEEAQFLNTIKASATQIAAIFRVDPDDIGGDSGSTKKYSNREQDQQRFNNRTLLPWAVRIEEPLSSLLPPGLFVRFNLDALARPDMKARAEVDNIKLKNGSLTQAEARAHDEKPPLTEQEHQAWLNDYTTMRSEAEATSTSTSTSVVAE